MNFKMNFKTKLKDKTAKCLIELVLDYRRSRSSWRQRIQIYCHIADRTERYSN